MEKSNISIDLGSNRNFGFVFTLFFGMIAGYGYFTQGIIWWWAVIASILMLLISLVYPSILEKPKQFWSKFGLLLGSVIAPIVMALVYITTVVPIGLIMQWTGKDLLNLRVDKNAKSYWIKRESSPQSMKNQF